MARRHSPPRPVWLTVPGLGVQLVGIFLLPFLVGLAASMVLEVSEVAETADVMTAITVVFLLPITLAQVLGLLLKSRRELRWWRSQGALGPARALDVLHEHARVVTIRGWMLLVTGLALVVTALALKWASFGLLAVLGLFLFYLVTGWTIFVSTFLVGSFEAGLGAAEAGIRRQVLPAVCAAGEPVEEVFSFRHVRVPWGYYLLVEDPLPVRLATESRYVVGATAKHVEVEARGRLRRTPRGHYFLGPARLWYQDVLGITRVSVASMATAELKVLPPLRPVEVVDPPRTPMDTPDILTRPQRFATEDHFRFREYAAGDDTRRIHWRLSLRSGHLQVRQPESKEIHTRDVLLVLDAFLPTGKVLDAADAADDILDGLVEAWLGIARELLARGDRVTLIAACSGHDRDDVRLERIACRAGEAARWQDLGARARWQGRFTLGDMLGEIGGEVHGVVVTCRFTAPPPDLAPGQTLSWLFMDPADALPPEPHWLTRVIGGNRPWHALLWTIRLPHPAGSEDNAALRRWTAAWRLWRRWSARETLRHVAHGRAGRIFGELATRGDAVYRIERSPTHVRLVGLQGQVRLRRAS